MVLLIRRLLFGMIGRYAWRKWQESRRRPRGGGYGSTPR
jgi:hypothetical protein